MFEEKKEASRLGSSESWRELFVDKPDPTAVEVARVREAAETKRAQIHERAETRRRILIDHGFQILVGCVFLVVFGAGAIITCLITSMHRPMVMAAPEPCADSITRVSKSIGTFGCQPGQKFELKNEDDGHELVICTCPNQREPEKPVKLVESRESKDDNDSQKVSETACLCPHYEDDAGLLVDSWWNPDGGLSMNPRIVKDSCECRDKQKLLRIANRGKK